MQKSTHQRYFIKSLARGLNLLERMAEAGRPMTLSEVAESAGMTPTTAYRFLYTLQAIDLVEKDPDLKLYRIAPGVLKLG